MKTSLGRVIIVVDDYDRALDFYQKNFFCRKLHDSTTPYGQRFLHIGFSEDDNTSIWFLKADSAEQKAKIGKQTAGQPTLTPTTAKGCTNI